MTAQGRTLAIGDTIGGRYLLEGVLGEGGMAMVYRARHLGTGRQCALKVIHPHLITRPELIELFIREAQVGARIGPNPHIVDVFDAGADEARGVPYLAMELLQGETLEAYCKHRGPMPPPLVRTVFEQLGEALDQAHRAGIVHRDLKPSNLFLATSHKGEPTLKVVDFGIAKALEGEPSRTATQIGTPAYAAPEQFGAAFRDLAARQGITISSTVSPATDVWALGLIAFDVLVGATAGQYWGASTVAELPLKVAIGQFDLPSVRAGGRASLLPPGFDPWFGRCLQRNALDRWRSAGQATTELARLLGGGAPAPAYTPASYAGTELARPPPPAAPARGSPHGPSPPGPVARMGPPPGSVGWSPQLGAAPLPSTAHTNVSAKAPSSSKGCLVAGVVGVVALVIAVPLVGSLVRSSNTHAAAKSCESDNTRCDDACDAGDLPSCVRLGELAQAGKTVALDAARAVSLYEKACDGKELAGCSRLAFMRLHGLGGKPRDPSEAMRLATLACDGKNQLGCTLLGEILRDAPGTVSRDDTRARALFQTACDSGEPRACVDVGVMLMEGRGGVAQDDTKAVSLFQKTCDVRITIGCSYLSRMTQDGRGGLKKDAARAARVAQKACDDGDLWSCEAYGVALALGAGGLTKDLVKAAAVFQKTCDGGGDWACTDLGVMYDAGLGGLPKDLAKAAELYRIACEASHGRACSLLGGYYVDGKAGLAKSPEQALALFRRACDNGFAGGCYNSALLLVRSEPPLKDEAQANVFYRKGCDLGAAAACTELGANYGNGRGGLPVSQNQANGLYKKACDAGDGLGCSNLAASYADGAALPKDPSMARSLFHRACGLGYARSCFFYGTFCGEGRGGPVSLAEAMSNYKTACDGGAVEGCGNLGWYYFKGIAGVPDRDKGADLLKRACAAGEKWSCAKLKEARIR